MAGLHRAAPTTSMQRHRRALWQGGNHAAKNTLVNFSKASESRIPAVVAGEDRPHQQRVVGKSGCVLPSSFTGSVLCHALFFALRFSPPFLSCNR